MNDFTILDNASKQGESNAVRITSKALNHLRQYLQDNRQEGDVVRLGVRKNGCSGYSYVVSLADHVADADNVLQVEDVKFVVDMESMPFLQGIEIDYVKEGVNRGLRFQNPNAVSTCGCGESFSVGRRYD